MPELKLLAQETAYELITRPERLREVAHALSAEPVLGVDVEATGLDPHTAQILLVQVATPTRAFVFDARLLDLTPLASLFLDEKILKVAQNAKFDYGMLKEQLQMEMNNIFDTMLAERILTMGIARDNSLRSLARKYLNVELSKETRETFYNHTRAFSKRQIEYAAADVLVLFSIMEKQESQLKREGLWEIAQMEFKLVPVVAEMELRGFLIDVKKWRGVVEEYRKKAAEVSQKIQAELRPYSRHTQTDLFGNQVDVVNLNSPAQVLEAFRMVGLDLPSTGEGILSQQAHPLAKLLLEHRGYEKITTAFGENLLSKINPKTGRVHPDYMQIGADTGRFACSNPNLQQIPTDSLFRGCFIASPGYKLVIADYSQIELRIMADLSADPVFVKAFKDDEDLHALTASQMFNIPLKEISKEKRFQAKSINFGLMYGRGARSLGVQLGVSEEESTRLLNKYFSQYKRVKNWLDQVSKDAVKLGFSQTMGGRKRYYQKVSDGDPGGERLVSYIERQGKNTPIQGTSADMTKYGLVYVRERFKREGLDATPIHTVHDEIVCEVKADQAQKAVKILVEEMTRAGEKFLKNVPVKVDGAVSDIWEH
ncbi:MAG: DNA polymerase [Patescibacteria group bacterium]